MKDETVWDFSQCLIGHPCNICIETCSFRKGCIMDNKEKEQHPCDVCPPPHMCGYCTLDEEWDKTHPKNTNFEKFDWE